MKAWVYILASGRNGTLYIGSTTSLHRRLNEHHFSAEDSFVNRYGVRMLVHAEQHPDIVSARHRERRLKKWRRQWKIRLIEQHNPSWTDLSTKLFDE